MIRKIVCEDVRLNVLFCCERGGCSCAAMPMGAAMPTLGIEISELQTDQRSRKVFRSLCCRRTDKLEKNANQKT